MLFSEVYGSYFNTVAAVLSLAVREELTEKKLTETVAQYAFGESLLTIPAALRDGSWPLLKKDLTTPLHNEPGMPLSLLQKQWMKALLQDPRIRLFNPSETGLEDVEPLYKPEVFVFFDQYTDGDPYENKEYIEHFRTILQALREKRKIRIRFVGGRGIKHKYTCIPQKLEYSAKDDKFRLITAYKGQLLTINLARVRGVTLLEAYKEEEYLPGDFRDRELVMELVDERNALERAMLQFSDLEKETVKLDDRHYQITLHYKQEDETEILIRILAFGPVLMVKSPKSIVRQIRQRLGRQEELDQEQQKL
jgi:hypothetical protein